MRLYAWSVQEDHISSSDRRCGPPQKEVILQVIVGVRDRALYRRKKKEKEIKNVMVDFDRIFSPQLECKDRSEWNLRGS